MKKKKEQQSVLVSLIVVVLFVVGVMVLLDYARQYDVDVYQEDAGEQTAPINQEAVRQQQQANAPGGIFVLTGEEE